MEGDAGDEWDGGGGLSGDSGNGGGCFGCLGFILICVAFWALLFGITVSGKHYGISGCSCDKGVEIDK